MSKAGKKGPCPKCGETLVIPKMTAQAKPASPAKPADGDMDWGALAAAEATAAPGADAFELAPDADIAAPAPAAPQVARKLTPRERAMAKMPAGKPAKAGRAPRPAAADGPEPFIGFPSMFAAIALGVAGAVLGGIAWWAAYAATGKEVRFIAWLLGLLVGSGIWLGRGGNFNPLRKNALTVPLAALIAIGGIITVKLLIHEVGREELFVSEIKTEAEQVVERERERIIYEHNQPIPKDEVFDGVMAWLGGEFRRDTGLSDARYAAMPDTSAMAAMQDVRLQITDMEADERHEHYARWQLALQEPVDDPAEARAAHEAARLAFMKDNDMIDPYEKAKLEWAAFEADREARIRGELGDDATPEDLEAALEVYTDDEEKWMRRARENPTFMELRRFEKAMKPFYAEHDPILQDAIWAPHNVRFDKFAAMPREQVLADYEALREKQLQEKLDSMDIDAIYASEIAQERGYYGDEYVDADLNPNLFQLSDLWFGLVAVASAMGIAALAGKE